MYILAVFEDAVHPSRESIVARTIVSLIKSREMNIGVQLVFFFVLTLGYQCKG